MVGDALEMEGKWGDGSFRLAKQMLLFVNSAYLIVRMHKHFGVLISSVQLLSCVRLFVTPWTVARQFLCPWGSPGKNTRVGCHFLLQRKRKAWVFISDQLAPSRELRAKPEFPLEGGVLLWEMMLVQLAVSSLSLSL